MLKSIFKKFVYPSGALCLSICFSLFYNMDNFKKLGEKFYEVADNKIETMNRSNNGVGFALSAKDDAIQNSWILQKVNELTGNRLTQGLGNIYLKETKVDGKQVDKIFTRVNYSDVENHNSKYKSDFNQGIDPNKLKTGQCIVIPIEEKSDNGEIKKKYRIYYSSYIDPGGCYFREYDPNIFIENFNNAKDSAIEIEKISRQ